MGVFDRRKEAKPSPGAEPEVPPEGAAEEPATPTRQIHTVGPDETLADLAARYGVPAEEIARQNHVPPPGQIHAGQVLVIRS